MRGDDHPPPLHNPRVTAGRLFVVATPIGTLDDLSVRAVRVLKEADAILAEDTRRTRILCQHHGVGTPLRSFHAHSPESLALALVDELRGGARLALVSDAGTPIISDPGALLVRAAADAGVAIESIPGPSAVTTALAVAAIPCDVFRFVGFLPRSGGRRRRVLDEIASERGATVLFEAPNRIGATLRDLAGRAGGDRRAAVCRELTKLHEEVARGTLAELAARFEEGTRGEVTIVVEGRGGEAGAKTDEEMPSEEDVAERVAGAIARGESPRDVARSLAEETGMSKRDAYRRVLDLVGRGGERR